ncbi:MAG: PAS domain-containing protein, partial [Desulfobulbales bacterium]|nr:PAS domain-containing protein [Desulfobulbales bacterium]
KFLAVGRRIKEGHDPFEEKKKLPEDPVENLIARLTYYVMDHQRIEKELSRLKEFYESIVDNQQTGILVMDKDHKVIYANKHMHKMTDIPSEAILGTNPYDAGKQIPGLDISEFTGIYNNAFEQQQPLSYKNIKTIMPSGATIFMSGWFNPKYKDGRFDGMVCLIYDTTISHLLRNLLVNTLDFSPCAIGVVQQFTEGEQPRIYFLNRQFKEIFGLKKLDPAEFPFHDTVDLMTARMKNGAQWLKFINETIKANTTDAKFIIEMKKGKTLKWVSNPLIDENGVHWGRIATVEEMKKRVGRKKS